MDSQSTVPTPVRSASSVGVHRLLVLFSPEPALAGKSVVLGASEIVIGRETGSGSASLSLPDEQLSRSHSRVSPDAQPGTWTLHDAGSRNGTFLDARRVESARLEPNQVIRVGSHVLLFQRLTVDECESLGASRRRDSALVGDSYAMVRVRERIGAVGPLAVPVLILGESGVGKELVAQEVHRTSGRSGAFVAVNCAALPEHLAESELFGHARGAFTGATGHSDGLFGEADAGTLFLDEIGEMPLPLQAKLLRALATGEVRAVGETRNRRVDVRIVAATNVDLERAVENGSFRGDVLSRLWASVIDVPPLRERRDDILGLAGFFWKKAGATGSWTADAAEALVLCPWRFNVREVAQVMQVAAGTVPQGAALELDHLPERFHAPLADRHRASSPPARAEARLPLVLRIRRDAKPSADDLREVLGHFEGNVVRVAEYFEKDRRQIYRWAESLGIDLSGYRTEE